MQSVALLVQPQCRGWLREATGASSQVPSAAGTTMPSLQYNVAILLTHPMRGRGQISVSAGG